MMEFTTMTYAAPSFDYYDDGLVHSHEWARNTPPGTHHAAARTAQAPRAAHDHDDGLVHDHRWARN
jgi:hypothetical protein